MNINQLVLRLKELNLIKNGNHINTHPVKENKQEKESCQNYNDCQSSVDQSEEDLCDYKESPADSTSSIDSESVTVMAVFQL
eukprot:12741225-Ditylum_brightwellii.AAC.1